MATTSSHRKPSLAEQVLVVILTLYAVAVISLDTLRPFAFARGELGSTWPWRWFPIATLGFEADNNGKIVSVDLNGPATVAGLKPDQHIELASVRPDRRAINKFVYVAHGSTYQMRILDAPGGPHDVELRAADENLEGWNAPALLIAQASALFFIALCVYLVWHRATWSSWGFFLYGMWFNSGQYFVWYANLSTAGLVIFDALEAFVQALALTGFLAFALYFPEERPPRDRIARAPHLLAAVFAVLWISGTLAFFNFFLGWQTEVPYSIYYGFTFVVYFLAAWAFVRNFRRLRNQRPRMRWIVAAGLIGLPCFLLADIYEATALFRSLPWGVDAWIHDHDWMLNLMYASNVLLPAAVLYTALHHEVMSVRFGITRAVILSAIFLVSVAVLHGITTIPMESFMEQREALKPLAVPLSLLLAIGLALIHNPLHSMVERVFAPKWHRGKRRLQELAQQLMDNDTLTAAAVDDALVKHTTDALWLEYGGLFRHHPSGGFTLGASHKWPRGKKQLREDDHWVRCALTGRPLADPDEAPDEPELALAVRRSARQSASRLVVYGHHVTRERIDPDESRIITEVARAAALAYMRLDFEALSAAKPKQ